jgi:hypothetical protein
VKPAHHWLDCKRTALTQLWVGTAPCSYTSAVDEPEMRPMVVVFMMTSPQLGFPASTTPNGLAQTDANPDMTMCGVDLESDPNNFEIIKVQLHTTLSICAAIGAASAASRHPQRKIL